MLHADHETDVGCRTCVDTNVSNATWGIVQLVQCEDSNIETVDEALEFVETEARDILGADADVVSDTTSNQHRTLD